MQNRRGSAWAATWWGLIFAVVVGGAAAWTACGESDDDNPRPPRSFQRAPEGRAEELILRAPAGAQQGFGAALAASASGEVVAVGAPLADEHGADSGVVYVWEYVGEDRWESTRLTAGEGSQGSHFGYALNISDDGRTLVVGAPHWDESRGAALVYRRGGAGEWASSRLVSGHADSGDGFGAAVDVDPKGEVVIVGAEHDVYEGIESGTATVFRSRDGGWQQTRLAPSGGRDDGDLFGHAVALGERYLAIGAPGIDAAQVQAGAVYVVERGSPPGDSWRMQAPERGSRLLFEYGSSVGVDGDQVVVGAPGGFESGAVYAARRHGGRWVQQRVAGVPSGTAGRFGEAVAVVGQRVLVGAALVDGGRDEARSAYLFDGGESGWPGLLRLRASGAPDEHLVGPAVALAGRRAFVALRAAAPDSVAAGVAVFEVPTSRQ